jgi:hypothetical protein
VVDVAVPVSKLALLVKTLTVEDSPGARPEIEINPEGLTTAVALSFELLALQLYEASKFVICICASRADLAVRVSDIKGVSGALRL